METPRTQADLDADLLESLLAKRPREPRNSGTAMVLCALMPIVMLAVGVAIVLPAARTPADATPYFVSVLVACLMMLPACLIAVSSPTRKPRSTRDTLRFARLPKARKQAARVAVYRRGGWPAGLRPPPGAEPNGAEQTEAPLEQRRR